MSPPQAGQGASPVVLRFVRDLLTGQVVRQRLTLWPAFVYSDHDTGRVATILGYPTDKLSQIG